MFIKTKVGRSAMNKERKELIEIYNRLLEEGKGDTDEFKDIKSLLMSVNQDIMLYDQNNIKGT